MKAETGAAPTDEIENRADLVRLSEARSAALERYQDLPDPDFAPLKPKPACERLTRRGQVPAWLEQLASDTPDMEPICYRVGIKLTGRIDWREGRATFDQKEFATELNVHPRTVRRAFSELSLRSHIERTVRRGNGQWNLYYLTFKR